MSDGSIRRQGRQDAEAPPVVDNPGKPRMDEGPARKKRIGRATLLMADEPQPVEGGPLRMAPVPGGQPPSSGAGGPPPGDQVGAALPAARESYIRLRISVEDGVMTVSGAREVPGPLVQPTSLHSGYAYEVSVGPRRVAVGLVPDVGVRRSFPPPEGAPGPQGHFIMEVTSFEFAARVPRQQLTLAALPRTGIILFRVKDSASAPPIGPQRLGSQFERELRVVAQIQGIDLAKLPGAVQEELRQSLQ